MFFITEAANIDPDAFAWLVFTRSTKMRLTGYHQRHVLTLAKGDIFGIKRTRSNTYQLVKSDAMHILYRNISDRTYGSIMKNSIPYKGPTPSEQEVEEGYVRRRKVRTKEPAHTPQKRTDDYYIPTRGRIVERYQIDLGNYQWRKVAKGPIRLVTKKQGKAKGMLRSGDIVGMRYRSPARGGYIVLDGNNRMHISHELYTQIVQDSRVLPTAQQKSGLIDLETGKREAEEKPMKRLPVKKKPAPKPKELPPEEPVEKLYDLDSLQEEEILQKAERRSRVTRNMRRTVRKLLEVPESETWVENDEEEFEQEAPEETPEEETEGEPTERDLDKEDAEEARKVDEEDREEESEPSEDEEADATIPVVEEIEPGTIIRMTKGSQRHFVVVDAQIMERNENLMEYILFDPDADEDDEDVVMYKLRIGIRMPMAQFKEHAEIEGDYDTDKLKPLMDSVEYATFKPISLVK